ncbi:hypothetical protein HFN89_03845 [Rhizobium laguerreae]|nr:hypothetical protein [Rhizobium laguerreae]
MSLRRECSIRNSCIVVLILLVASSANGQDSYSPLFNYPNTKINGLVSGEVPNKSLDECREICVARGGCAGFDHSEKSVCRIFANVGSATSTEGSVAETRIVLSGYRTPTNPAPDWASLCEQEASPKVGSKGVGVDFKDLSAAHAIDVCRTASLAPSVDPDVWAFYARALDKGEQVKESAHWATESANRNSVVGQTYLGWLYASGRGVTKDDVEASRLYRLAADQGYAPAQHNLGVRYENGRGVAKDNVEAARLYRLAADQGYAPAQSNLGVMYENGRGVTKDELEALRLYRLAADQGYAPAQNGLGIMYHLGRGGVTKDNVEAVRLFRLAADQGDAPAQNNLGIMYQLGLGGVRKDKAEAARLYRLSADQGYETAKENLLGLRP